MNAIPQLTAYGAPFPAMNPIAESIPLAPNTINLGDDLTLSATDTGLIIYKATNPVCWLMAGYHEGQSDKQPKRCDFVDVAYHRQTQRGVNLESIDFLTLPDAIQFVVELFGTDVSGVQS